jgi:hypothetical protein
MKSSENLLEIRTVIETYNYSPVLIAEFNEMVNIRGEERRGAERNRRQRRVQSSRNISVTRTQIVGLLFGVSPRVMVPRQAQRAATRHFAPG